MHRSSGRIITTHVGSLPRSPELIDLLVLKDTGQSYDETALATRVRDSVFDIVRRQAEIGVDIVDDGEHSKSSFTTYLLSRIGGLTPAAESAQKPGPRTTRDYLEFKGAYDEAAVMLAARPFKQRGRMGSERRELAVTGPLTYIGRREVDADVERLRSATAAVNVLEGFVTALSPGNVAGHYRNEFYPTGEEYLIAIADTMNVEYRAIVDAGFVLQIDDPGFVTYWDRNPGISLAECRHFMMQQVEVLNHALRGIPEDRVRYHTCYSTNIAPRAHDLELRDYVDIMLRIRAGAYSIEAANPRHDHEWAIWEHTKLPENKILMPGVVSHCVSLVEHPALVAQRIVRFANVVGRENVVASNDCGFATSAAGDEVHPDVAWAKMRALVEGARIASEALWK